MSAHTPGPWRIFEFGDDGIDPCPGIEAGAKTIVLWGDGTDGAGVCGETPEEAVANARLIAAAPELLGQHEANLVDLDLLQRALSVGEGALSLAIRIDELMRRTRALIAKATQP